MCYSTRLWRNEWLLDLASAIAPWPWLLNETWHVIVSGVDGATPATERGNPISGRNARTVSACVHKFLMASFRILLRCSLPNRPHQSIIFRGYSHLLFSGPSAKLTCRMPCGGRNAQTFGVIFRILRSGVNDFRILHCRSLQTYLQQ